MSTLREFFDTDFARALITNAGALQVQRADTLVDLPVRVHMDFDANAKYLSCYLAAVVSDSGVCRAVMDDAHRFLEIGAGLQVQMGWPGEANRASTDLQFAGRLFVYHEGRLDDGTVEELTAYGRTLGLFPQFRGPDFAAERTKLEKPVAFICHDSRDKEAIARPLAVALSRCMYSVWFDEFSLKVGDRLRESIERGLRETKKCILVVTPHFLTNGGWTKTEFSAVFSRELIEQEDVVLPIWHDVSARQVFEYSPTLADRFAVSWELGSDEVVRRLRRSLD